MIDDTVRLGANYPNNLGSPQQIQQTAKAMPHWMKLQVQGKGYEWDFMTSQRSDPSNMLSTYKAGTCPTQPGIDVIETDLLTGKVKTYQNKAYTGAGNPDLSHTPKDTVVVTNREKEGYAQKQGYQTEGNMDTGEIETIQDRRFKQAAEGKASTAYKLKNITAASVKAGLIGAVIGMTTETVASYREWKSGRLSNEEYLKEVLKVGGEAGVTGTAAVMVPVQAAVTAAGPLCFSPFRWRLPSAPPSTP